jgi:glycosyltransferase involved in cell wall biosynthesis
MRTSLIITAFNYASYIQRSVRSCLNQRYIGDEIEVIVVDDASTDETSRMMEPFRGDPRFHYVRHDENRGVAAAANTGFCKASGQYVARVDADDFVSEMFGFFLTSYLEFNHDLFGVACDYVLVDEAENKIGRKRPDEEPIACGILYRKDLLVKQGLYDETFRHCEEEELRARLGTQYRVERLGLPLYRYRMHGSNKTKQAEYRNVLGRFRANE